VLNRCDVHEFLLSMQQSYAAANVLAASATRNVKLESEGFSRELNKILETLTPFIPQDTPYEAYVVDNVDVAITTSVADGGQIILLGRHFICFLRNLIDSLVSGLEIADNGFARVRVDLNEHEKTGLGKTLGQYLELGIPLEKSVTQIESLGPEILVAALEFMLTHEITHRIEAHDESEDFSLSGFQDYCRMRGREYHCDTRAVALTLYRRRETPMPELAFVGAIAAMLAVSWTEQFTPGFTPGGERGIHHPGSDSRLLRIYLEEELYWSAAKLNGNPSDLSGAVLRRAFRFMGAFEKQPKLLESPLNILVRRATKEGNPQHELFQSLAGELLARGKVVQVARGLGYIWGSSILMKKEETDDTTITDKGGTLAVPLFEQMYDRIKKGGYAAKEIAEEISDAKEFHLAQADSR
jgi:hypothetical protein